MWFDTRTIGYFIFSAELPFSPNPIIHTSTTVTLEWNGDCSRRYVVQGNRVHTVESHYNKLQGTP